jgi:hypothetical protein
MISSSCSTIFKLRHSQWLNKKPNMDPIVLDDVDPSSKWIEETHPVEFDANDLQCVIT